jgi:hypothetical protein
MNDIISGLFGLISLLIPLAAWLTHVIVCLKLAKWGFLIAGALFFPIGIVHGIGIWFGAW